MRSFDCQPRDSARGVSKSPAPARHWVSVRDAPLHQPRPHHALHDADPPRRSRLAAAPQKELWADYAAFNDALSKAGAGSGERLQPSSAATTVRQRNGKTDVLDG